jgi:hypothetical protein
LPGEGRELHQTSALSTVIIAPGGFLNSPSPVALRGRHEGPSSPANACGLILNPFGLSSSWGQAPPALFDHRASTALCLPPFCVSDHAPQARRAPTRGQMSAKVHPEATTVPGATQRAHKRADSAMLDMNHVLQWNVAEAKVGKGDKQKTILADIGTLPAFGTAMGKGQGSDASLSVLGSGPHSEWRVDRHHGALG